MQDPITNEIRYIGLSTQGYRRISDHFHKFKLDKDKTHKGRWLKLLRQQNLYPRVRIIQEFQDITRDKLAECEKYWIKFHRDLGCPLTNLTDGGDGVLGHKWSATHANRLNSHPRLGKVWSEEQRKILSIRTKEAMTNPAIKAKYVGIKHKKTGKSWNQKKIIDNTGSVFDSIKKAADFLNVTVGAIKHVLAGRNSHCKGYTFRYLELT